MLVDAPCMLSVSTASPPSAKRPSGPSQQLCSAQFCPAQSLADSAHGSGRAGHEGSASSAPTAVTRLQHPRLPSPSRACLPCGPNSPLKKATTLDSRISRGSISAAVERLAGELAGMAQQVAEACRELGGMLEQLAIADQAHRQRSGAQVVQHPGPVARDKPRPRHRLAPLSRKHYQGPGAEQ